jgi:PKD repeat protein
MKVWWLSISLFLLSPALTLAQTPTITEISPRRVNSLEEWFEFSLQSESPVDITDWVIFNDKSSRRVFGDFEDRLIIPNSLENLSGKTVIVDEDQNLSEDFPADRLIFWPRDLEYFYWEKSPLSLPDGGGTIQILDDQGQILDEVIYPATKSGTVEGDKFAEIWNRDSGTPTQVLPLVFRDNGDAAWRHTRGELNLRLPTPIDKFEILVSEVSLDRGEPQSEVDFIELYIKSTVPDRVNLKYLEIKHNGTSLILVNQDLWVQTGDFIVLQFDGNPPAIQPITNPIQISTNERDGLSSGSGTVELILYSGTSLEVTEDFFCWKDEKLSQTEQQRVEKNINLGHWQGACFEVSELIPNESVARFISYPDSNQVADWFRHFNGSEGEENNPQNQPPVARIRIQGSGKLSGTPPFSVNPTGEDSTDPDGAKDLATFEWELNSEVFSDRENPLNFKIEIAGTYTIKLTVTDFSGAQDMTELVVTVHRGGGVGNTDIKIEAEQWLQDIQLSATQAKDESAKEEAWVSFFKDFILVSGTDLPVLLEKSQPVLSFTPSVKPLFQRDQFTLTQRQRVGKNLGLIFLE